MGCGAGEVLRQLQSHLTRDCHLWGFEISPQAFQLCQTRGNEKLKFKLGDIRDEEGVFFDVMLAIDVIEHIEDYFTFLRSIHPKSEYKVLHVPLELSVQALLRQTPLVVARRSIGHIHYFTKDMVLQILSDIGYQVIDYFYTPAAIDRRPASLKGRLARVPRRALFRIGQDLAVRMLGGYSLMVLAK